MKEVSGAKAQEATEKAVQDAVDGKSGRNKVGKGVARKCGYCREVGHRYMGKKGHVTCPLAQEHEKLKKQKHLIWHAFVALIRARVERGIERA